MSRLSVPHFSLIGARIRVLWWILQSVRNEEKNEEIKTKFCSLVSRKWMERFSSNLVCRLPNWPAPPWKISLQSDGGSPSYIGVKIAFSFFLLIYSRCSAPASWAARRTTVCLDIYPVIAIKKKNLEKIVTQKGVRNEEETCDAGLRLEPTHPGLEYHCTTSAY